ncbi:UNVERIFIED_CONTAM: hypothetical protein GTU68_047329 [Idotea baltica]|nr:hypothetical protein [Idotea baltica]
MTKEILLVAEAVSNEKGVPEGIIFEAIELALATATKKRYDEDADIEVTIDRETGDYVTIRRWLVVPDEEMALLGTQFTTEEAIEVNASLVPGDIHQEEVENIGFGRIAAQTAKQVIVQRVREAEREQVMEAYIDRTGELIAGTVKKAVSNELDNERVDIVLWDDNPAQLVINAMAPAEVESIVVDEDSETMDVAVSEDNLAQAIGRGGQNVRLAGELTGWTINVMSTEEAAEKHDAEDGKVITVFTEKLDISDDVAEILVEEGFTSLEEVAYVPLEEMTAIEGFDEEIAEELRSRAKDALLTQAIASEEELGEHEPAEDLLTMDGMDKHLAFILASREIVTMEDLAEQAVDDLLDIPDMTEERAGELIMTARAPWFAAEDA